MSNKCTHFQKNLCIHLLKHACTQSCQQKGDRQIDRQTDRRTGRNQYTIIFRLRGKKVSYWVGFFFQNTWTIWLVTSLAVKGISYTRCSPVSRRRVGAVSVSGPDSLTTRHGTLATPLRPSSPSSINWFKNRYTLF